MNDSQPHEPSNLSDPDYEIGYGKPPKKHQFKKGAKSPNSKGRPKGAKGIKTLVCAAAEAQAEFVINGKKTKAARIEIAMHQLALKAAKGEIKAIDRMAQLYAQYGPPSPVDESMLNQEADHAVLADLVALAAKFASPPSK